MIKAPKMTADIAQAISIELDFLVPQWQQTRIEGWLILTAPAAFREDTKKFALEVERIADFVSYARSRHVDKLADDRMQIKSTMKDGAGFSILVVIE
jgi:hypothetical protein